MVSSSDLAQLVRLSFDNTRAEDARKDVIPVFQGKHGEVKRLLQKLRVAPEKGVSHTVESKYGTSSTQELAQLWTSAPLTSDQQL